MLFPEKLKAARTKAHLTQEQLAKELHISRQAVTKWETGNGNPDLDNIKRISEILDVSIDYLVKDEISDEPKEQTPQPTEPSVSKKVLIRTGIVSVAVTAGVLLGAYAVYRSFTSEKGNSTSISTSLDKTTRSINPDDDAVTSLRSYLKGVSSLLDKNSIYITPSWWSETLISGDNFYEAKGIWVNDDLDVSFECNTSTFIFTTDNKKYIGAVKECTAQNYDSSDFYTYILDFSGFELAALVYKPTDNTFSSGASYMDIYTMTGDHKLNPQSAVTFYITNSRFNKPDSLKSSSKNHKPLKEDIKLSVKEHQDKSASDDMWIAGEAIRLDGKGGTE